MREPLQDVTREPILELPRRRGALAITRVRGRGDGRLVTFVELGTVESRYDDRPRSRVRVYPDEIEAVAQALLRART